MPENSGLRFWKKLNKMQENTDRQFNELSKKNQQTKQALYQKY